MASAAFMARMDGGDYHSGAWDVQFNVIPFNTVLLKVGLNYTRLTSVFTCAETGLYHFSVTLYSDGDPFYASFTMYFNI